MAIVRKTIGVTQDMDEWVKMKVASGQFTNDSEVHRAALKRVREWEEKKAWLQAEVQKGLDSGFCDQSPREIIAELKDEMRANGELK